MTDTFRALCTERVDDLELCNRPGEQGVMTDLRTLIERALDAMTEETAVPTPPADGEVAELVARLREEVEVCWRDGYDDLAFKLTRAAELLERQALAPVPVSERPWEREGWCDAEGNCWLGGNVFDGSTPTWIYGPSAWAERFPNVHRVLLPAHASALPLPEVRE